MYRLTNNTEIIGIKYDDKYTTVTLEMLKYNLRKH